MGVSRRHRNLMHYLREAKRRSSLRFAAWRAIALPSLRRIPDRLIVAPTDLRASDPFIAEEIAAGRFALAGRMLAADGKSPFTLELPSREFAHRLHSFSWLRHVRASRSDTHSEVARQLAADWLAIHGRRITGVAWEADIVAQRIIAWLSHSTVLLKGADIRFYRRFLRSLTAQVRYLEKIAHHVADGEARLRVRIALAAASVSIPSSGRRIKRAAQLLNAELDRQILSDGGHISRNPRTGLELLLDLLPLRQTYVNLGHDVPVRLIPAIDRMYPALRFFRHQGGELALFNGATTTLANELMSVLRYDETAGKPFKALPHVRYQRLALGDTVILVDTGTPMTAEMSKTAHAGCLSFEMSSGRYRFIINSGAPRFAGEHYRQLSRATAAHSTVTVNDTSSSRISRSAISGPIFADGVTSVKMERRDSADGVEELVASHDGYLEPFGLIHERMIHLNEAGSRIRGRDRLMTADGAEPDASVEDTAVIRFHIHPQVDIRPVSRHEVRLVAPDGETWLFSTADTEIDIEDDVFFADPSGIRASRQIELSFRVGEVSEVQWVMTRKPAVPVV
ncbi:heparinase II/III family protein [Rhizobium sp. KVB221]|uniref:Heparinase II/III family protein n=1 Tax=Rhizobium setariae TaxID=2801340 RepID=A0A936YSP1_9HYPH|nr:heparinase II/III family protein [Rhizobium setariae]MBL0374132.1 heparinase II/III family protein [Rhizobium setariae]